MTGIRTLFASAALSAFGILALGAFATPALADNVRVQSGLICDTIEHATRVSELVEGNDFGQAIIAVNLEAAKPAACGFMAVAYTDAEQTHDVRAENGVQLFRIIRITVVGVPGPNGLKKVAPVTRFVLAPALSIEA
ncbi:hypothetical protein [Terrarubrum flagellatum]|uniref:hypothetical protein n=1 Tax=Terrirubrum flagellatum TaxID=2895980 RepID=UPI0031453E68